MTQHDTPEAVEAICRCLQTLHDQLQLGALDCAVLLSAMEKLRRLHQRAVDAEREREDARKGEAEAFVLGGQAFELAVLPSRIATARADALREFQQGCPFDYPKCNTEPETPCPMCGDMGTWDAENLGKPSRCVSLSRKEKSHDR